MENKTSFIVNLIDTFPIEGFNLVGTTTGYHREYLTNISIEDNFINLNGLFYSNEKHEFEEITKLKDDVTITVKNITAIYNN